MDTQSPLLRCATAGDAAAPIRLALRSQATRRYDAVVMAACRVVLTIGARSPRGRAGSSEEPGSSAGFYQLRIADWVGEAMHLLVAPHHPAAASAGDRGRISQGRRARPWLPPAQG